MEPRNYEADASASPPAAPAVPSVGYPTNGDPTSGTPATWPGAHWIYKVGESLRNLITSAGLTPDDGDLNLVQKAIVKLVSASNHVVRLEDVTFGPSVSDGDAVYWDNSNSRYDRAIADGTDKQKMVGFADVTNSLVEAFGRSVLFSGLTAGTKYFLSGSTAGAITATAQSEKVVVGLAKSATVMFVDIDPVAGTPIQDQSTWNAGTNNTESLISASKLKSTIQSSFSDSSLTSKGHQILPNGLIIQWGLINVPSSGQAFSVAETFDITFPNTCFSVVGLNSTASNDFAGYGGRTTTGFNAEVNHPGGTVQSGEYSYIAIGL